MRILVLQDDLFSYLQHVVRSYAGAGIDPEEGLGIFHLSQAIKAAQTVDDAQVAKVASGEIDGVPVATVAISDKGETN